MPPDSYEVGSVCTGYGGLEAGVAAALGGSPHLAWAADNDPHCATIIGHRFPGVPNLGDITTIDWEDIPPVDVLCGGFPCQPISNAGKQKGTADERWIWPYIPAGISRMAARPRVLVFENVPRLLSLEGGAVMDAVVRSLAEIGYVGRYGLFRADWAGCCHRRERWFLVAADAHALSAGPQGGIPAGGHPLGHRFTGLPGAPGPGGGGHPVPAHPDHGGPWLGGNGQAAARGGLPAVPHPGGIPGLQRRWAERGQEAGGWPPAVGRGPGDGPRLAPYPAHWRGPARLPEPAPLDWAEYAAAVARWERVFGIAAPCPVEPGRSGQPRMAAVFPEWMMGLPPGWVTGVPGLSRSAQLRAIGNGVVPAQAAMAVAYLYGPLEGQEPPASSATMPLLPTMHGTGDDAHGNELNMVVRTVAGLSGTARSAAKHRGLRAE